ncbi:MAG: AraC family transcriptional regulator [Sulfuritalea sp.]|nr:AraC family transcriptional regulator [Sulfuritalea sp.]
MANHFLFQSQDLDDARCVLSRLYKSHGLAVINPRRRLDVTAHFARLGQMTFSYLRYGTKVAMEPRNTECLDSFLIIQIPLRGHAEIHCGKESILSDQFVGSVVTPTLPLRMRWSDDCRQLTVRIERKRIEQHCASLLGRPLRKPIEFALAMPLDGGPCNRWLRLLRTILDDLDDPSGYPISSSMEAQLEQALMTELLLAHPNTYQSALCNSKQQLAPTYIRRVEEHIEAHAQFPLDVAALAEQEQVSVRAIYQGFQRCRGMSPGEYLKSVRLQRAHSELLAGDPRDAAVTMVATKWGFNHLGRFSNDYRRLFGELPSVTLRR